MSEFTIILDMTDNSKCCMDCANLGEHIDLSICICRRKKIEVDMWQDYNCEYFVKDNDN
jgi:hypothetical protein